MLRASKESVAVISGRARSQAPWWRKPGSKEKTSSTNSGHRAESSSEHEAVVGEVDSSFQEVVMEDAVVPFKLVQEGEVVSKSCGAVTSNLNSGSTDCLAKSIQGLCVANQDARELSQGHLTPPTFSGLVDFNNSHAKGAHVKAPLGDCTNQLSPLSQSTSLKTFKKLARNIVPSNQGMSNESVLVKRSVLKPTEVQGGKRQRVLAEGKHSKENIQVETGSQSHPAQ